jgi:hypothetical protein
MPTGDGPGRLDRIERILDAVAVSLERMREEHDRDYKQLMIAQVLMQDNLRILVENQKHFDQRVDKLVSVSGQFIRTRDNPSPLA